MKKKVFLVLLVIVMVISCVMTAYAMDLFSVDACSHNNGTAHRVLDGTHIQMGSGCRCTEQTYCDKCGTIFDTYEIERTQCPRWHKT